MPGRKSTGRIQRRLDTANIMQWVLLACLPGLATLIHFFGWGHLINLLWLAVCALGFEALVLRLRGRAIAFHLKDRSALVTALLLALCMPPTAPWWSGMCAVFFAIVVAKHLYGGLGQNVFNPAMVGYVVALIAFPLEMTTWIVPRGAGGELPSFSESLAAIFQPGGRALIDAYTGATALDAFKLQREGMLVTEFWGQSNLMGNWSGLGWEWVNLAFLGGGLVLLWQRIISWHIPVTMLVTLGLLAALFHDGGSSASAGPPLLHLLGGGTMLGAFFIATDPVSAAATPKGRLIYGALIGLLTFVIRAWGNYPDGIAFAVLLGNFAAPMIDYFTKPKHAGVQNDD